MNVERIADADGSHIEPALDGNWPPLEKLRWHAAVVALDVGGGVVLTVEENKYDAGRYHLSEQAYGLGIPGPFDFNDMWLFIIGIKIGAQMSTAKRVTTAAAMFEHGRNVSTGSVDDGA